MLTGDLGCVGCIPYALLGYLGVYWSHMPPCMHTYLYSCVFSSMHRCSRPQLYLRDQLHTCACRTRMHRSHIDFLTQFTIYSDEPSACTSIISIQVLALSHRAQVLTWSHMPLRRTACVFKAGCMYSVLHKSFECSTESYRRALHRKQLRQILKGKKYCLD